LSDKNVLQIVDQATDPDYSLELRTAALKKRAAGGMRKRSMHRMFQFTDRTPVRALERRRLRLGETGRRDRLPSRIFNNLGGTDDEN
jgi:hypothetical protein